MKPWEEFKLIQDTEYKTVGDDLQYKVQLIDGKAYLIFQESTSSEDWKNNFTFMKELYKNNEHHMRVHKGFGEVWKSGNDAIMKEFNEAVRISNTWPKIIGWSFGGAMAVLAAEDFNYRYGIACDVVTFGAPMVAGDKATKDYISGCGFFAQYAIKNDIVPLCPPLPGYRQIKKLKIGREDFNIFKLFQAEKYHSLYGNKEQYEKEN